MMFLKHLKLLEIDLLELEGLDHNRRDSAFASCSRNEKLQNLDNSEIHIFLILFNPRVNKLLILLDLCASC
jgi:hypothetical protein